MTKHKSYSLERESMRQSISSHAHSSLLVALTTISILTIGTVLSAEAVVPGRILEYPKVLDRCLNMFDVSTCTQIDEATLEKIMQRYPQITDDDVFSLPFYNGCVKDYMGEEYGFDEWTSIDLCKDILD